jgi:hypothetical protein
MREGEQEAANAPMENPSQIIMQSNKYTRRGQTLVTLTSKNYMRGINERMIRYHEADKWCKVNICDRKRIVEPPT